MIAGGAEQPIGDFFELRCIGNKYSGRKSVNAETNNPSNNAAASNVTIAEFQKLIHRMYFDKDDQRGISGTFMWLMEEMGELASDLREIELIQTSSSQDSSLSLIHI